MARVTEVRDLTANEVAVLADVSPRVVRKAIEEHVLAAGVARLPGLKRSLRKALGASAVEYLAVMSEIEWPLPIEGKLRIARWLRETAPEDRRGHVIIHGPLALDADKLAPRIKAACERTAGYRRARADWIVSDEAIMGGTPVIKGTRVTVYSVLGRLEAGDGLDEIAEDNPDIPLEALEAAAIFATANPMRGRPAGRPWASAA